MGRDKEEIIKLKRQVKRSSDRIRELKKESKQTKRELDELRELVVKLQIKSLDNEIHRRKPKVIGERRP